MKYLLCVVAAVWVTVKTHAQPMTGKSNPVYLDTTQEPPARIRLQYTGVKLVDANGNQAAEPTESVSIRFRITNPGPVATQRLLVAPTLTEPVGGFHVPELIRLHPIEPGQSVEVDVPLQLAADLTPGVAVVSIAIREATVFQPDVIELNVLTTGAVSAKNRRR